MWGHVTDKDAQSAVLLKDIMGRTISQDEAWDVADYLLACMTHVTNARPLFGVFENDTGLLQWSAGGAEFHDIFEHAGISMDIGQQDTSQGGASHFSQLLAMFGISGDDVSAVVHDVGQLSPGAAVTVLKPLAGAEGRLYRVALRRRFGARDHQTQFTLSDITAFQETALRTRKMAEILISGMDERIGGGPGAGGQLHSVVNDLQRLFDLQEDAEIAALAKDMSSRVTTVSEHMVAMLRSFEGDQDGGGWQPRALNPTLRPAIPVHCGPVQNWHELHAEVLRTVDDEPAIVAELARPIIHALSFVQHTTQLMVISPSKNRIFALNGAAAEKQFDTIDDFVRAIGVEENSTRSAVEFFANLEKEPALGVFAVGDENVEAWGRPGLYGGWQAILLPAQGRGTGGAGVDVRGLFHGLKNLLLHLQVLYVVNTRADVDQVQSGLSDTAVKIKDRLGDLQTIATTGQRGRKRVKENVGQWLDAARRVGAELQRVVDVSCDGISRTVYPSAPGEMEDTLEELVRNAFQHGAQNVTVRAKELHNHLCMSVTDDGPGMADDKLIQVQSVLQNRRYDPSLSTRSDGTGNGLLAAANAVSSFVDGQMVVDHGPGGRGVQIGISMKLPV